MAFDRIASGRADLSRLINQCKIESVGAPPSGCADRYHISRDVFSEVCVMR